VAPGRLAAILLCALAIAALVALAVIQKVRLEGVVLDLAQVSRCTDQGEVSCNPRQGDRVFVRFRMRTDSDDAVVRIVNKEGEPVATLLDGGPLAGGERYYTFFWDGRLASGEKAPPGYYRAEILLRDQDRDIVPDESVLLTEGGA
jgi:FlgD Ig-like domain